MSAEDIRRRAEAQVVADREAFKAEMESERREQVSAGVRAADVLADVEATIRGLETTLLRARGSVTDAEGAIDLMRAEMAGQQMADKPVDTSAGAPEDGTEMRPLGWLFRADRS